MCLSDTWQQYKEHILQLAASKPATQHLLEGIDDLDEGLQGFTIFVDKLHKVHPMVDDLNNSISTAYSPSSSAAVAESMIPFKGRSALKQYMPLKPVKRGYKV